MPHDKQGNPIFDGASVYVRIETFPGHYWEGIATVARVLLDRGEVCNLELIRTEARTWTSEDDNDRSMSQGVRMMHTGGHAKPLHVETSLLRASARDVVLVYSPNVGLYAPPGHISDNEAHALRAKLAESERLYTEARGMITEAIARHSASV